MGITRRCRGAEYRMTVTNRGRSGASRGAVGGDLIDGTLVPYAPTGSVVEVTVET